MEGFDIERFSQAIFKDRTTVVKVPELKKFFGKKEDPEWTVRGLTGQELAIVNNSVKENDGKEIIVQALMGDGDKHAKVEALRKAMNIIKTSDSVPDDLVRRHQTIMLGCVSPECPEDIAVKIGINFPTVLFKLSQKIYDLTGDGRVGE